MKKPSDTLPNNHEYGSHLATYYRVEKAGKNVGSFQNSNDALNYAQSMHEATGYVYDVFACHRFQHGHEESLYVTITPA